VLKAVTEISSPRRESGDREVAVELGGLGEHMHCIDLELVLVCLFGGPPQRTLCAGRLVDADHYRMSHERSSMHDLFTVEPSLDRAWRRFPACSRTA
jgi:hypothetical protein